MNDPDRRLSGRVDDIDLYPWWLMTKTRHLDLKNQHLPFLIGMAVLWLCGWHSLCAASDGAVINTPPAAVAEALPETTATVAVTIQAGEQGYRLYRGGQPYFIKGVGGRRYLQMAAQAGANSVRTWGTHEAGDLLDRAHDYGMTVTLGIWLSHIAPDYLDPAYRRRTVDEIQQVLDRHKNHPALLMWALGNEINLEGAGTPDAWQFVDELARMIKSQDPNHPVISVISFDDVTADTVAAYAPHLDALGINAYGTLSKVRAMIDASTFKGPYLITEWGVNGHWEAERTVWGRPIEPTSQQKVDFHLQRYAQEILANSDRCIGSYVFLWGQKQERTPTWYSMFIEQLPGLERPAAACATVDAMQYSWSGGWPSNRAPAVGRMTIDDQFAGGGVTFAPGQPFVASVEAVDPENDGLRFVWQMMAEPITLSTGGAYEPQPEPLGEMIAEDLGKLHLTAPDNAGEYRLFVYVLDPDGRVGTANVPFQVGLSPTPPPATAGNLASGG